MSGAAQKKKSYEELESELNELKHEFAKLSNFCLQLKKQVFGRRSERSTVIFPDALPLFPIEQEQEKDEEVEIAAHTRKKFSPRKPLPKDLPRERIIHEPEEKTCSCCGAELVKIGEEKSEELDYIPARAIIRV